MGIRELGRESLVNPVSISARKPSTKKGGREGFLATRNSQEQVTGTYKPYKKDAKEAERIAGGRQLLRNLRPAITLRKSIHTSRRGRREGERAGRKRTSTNPTWPAAGKSSHPVEKGRRDLDARKLHMARRGGARGPSKGLRQLAPLPGGG